MNTTVVEDSIHQELMKALQNVFDTYGVQVETVRAEWVMGSNMFGSYPKMYLTRLSLDSVAYPKR